MLEALVLIGIILFLVQLNQRLTRLERRMEGAFEPHHHGAYDDFGEEASSQDSSSSQVEEILPVAEPVAALISDSESIEDLSEPEFGETPSVDPAEDAETRRGFGFEELFGRRLPIWAGGITLAVAGMLIVKLSIEAGLLSPPVRVISGMLFGVALISAAEIALRQEERVRDERVRQALSGAGIASLYASVLVATNLYQLIGPLTAMLGMALITALALGLSIRFGPPSALLGLAGGLAAPALIGSDSPNIPLLSLYLALAVGGLCTVSRGQRWAWLGITALVGGFGWGLMLMIGGVLDAPSSISVGLYLLLLGIGLPMLGFAGDRQSWIQLVAAIAAAAQMAALVATGGFAMLNWGLFGLISLAMLWLSAREPALERLPPVGTLITLLLLGFWPDPQQDRFGLVMAGAAVIYGAPAFWRLWRERGGIIEAGQLSAVSLAGLLLPMFHFYPADGSADFGFGMLALAMAALAAGCAALGWSKPDRRDDHRFAILAISAALLLAGATTLLLREWLVGPAIAAVGLGLLLLGKRSGDWRLEPFAWIFAAVGLIACAEQELFDMDPAMIDVPQWGAIALLMAAFAWQGTQREARAVAQWLTPPLAYMALIPIVPVRYDPLIAPVMLAALASVRIRLLPAMAASTLIIAAWAIVPVGEWLAEVVPSIIGDPVFVDAVPIVDDAVLKLLIPAALIGLALWVARARLTKREWAWRAAVGITLVTVGLHSLYKQLFFIDSEATFVSFGLAERTIWEILLLGMAAIFWRLCQLRVSYALLACAVAHLALYSLLMHNPLWAQQAVGPWPILNWILAAYSVAAIALLAARAIPELRALVPDRLLAVSWMLLVLLFAASMLRQLFHGSLLTEPGLGQMEDIARSILAIALAIGFLLWGIRRQDRNWRIGSLLLMLGAVAKVFLWDTSGLEGLVRIASFVALGFSLIGIGWLYSRQLVPARA